MIVEELRFNKKHTGHNVVMLGLWFKDLRILCLVRSGGSV